MRRTALPASTSIFPNGLPPEVPVSSLAAKPQSEGGDLGTAQVDVDTVQIVGKD